MIPKALFEVFLCQKFISSVNTSNTTRYSGTPNKLSYINSVRARGISPSVIMENLQYQNHRVYHIFFFEEIKPYEIVKNLNIETRHVGLSGTYRYKRTGNFFIWKYIGNWYVFSKYLDNYCRYQYCANDTLFRNISSILRSIFQDILPKKDVAFCETTDTAHSYIKRIVNFSEINVSIDA